MTVIDRSKPIWRVTGYLPVPDLRRLTVLVNAETSSEAVTKARLEGMDAVSSTRLITDEDIARWEALVPPMSCPICHGRGAVLASPDIRDHRRVPCLCTRTSGTTTQEGA